MGFGKTTLAKKLEKELPAVRFTHDDFMCHLYARNLPDNKFRIAYRKVDELIWEMAEKCIKSGSNVILDYGFWSKEVRKKVNKRALSLTPEVIFHHITCDEQIAKQRVLNRSEKDEKSLLITENSFDIFWVTYEPISEDEGLKVITYDGSTIIPTPNPSTSTSPTKVEIPTEATATDKVEIPTEATATDLAAK